jgi:hypothetical protein
MRRFFNGLLVLSIVATLTAAPAYAAPRRDDGDKSRSPIKLIVQVIKKVVRALDGGDLSWPKP